MHSSRVVIPYTPAHTKDDRVMRASRVKSGRIHDHNLHCNLCFVQEEYIKSGAVEGVPSSMALGSSEVASVRRSCA